MISSLDLAKNIARPIRNFIQNKLLEKKIAHLVRNNSAVNSNTFDFNEFKVRILNFIHESGGESPLVAYLYSSNCSKSTLYASAYACMTLSLLGELENLSETERIGWGKYFDSFQSAEDGLFYDSVVHNELYNKADWWGARHLALHMVSAYTDLALKPRFKFKYLESYYPPGAICDWLERIDWEGGALGLDDVDNKIMNVGCLLQYQRDAWGDCSAGRALDELKGHLKSKLNPATGMWGGFDLKKTGQRSRAVQFAYHLFPIFFFDNDFNFDAENIVNTVLATQNKYGGYGAKLNSSACEDIDSIDLLIRFSPFCSGVFQAKIDVSIRRAFSWVLLNQVNDGGFVFRLFEPFVYGSRETSSESNIGAMLPTWFRTLSLAYMSRYLNFSHPFNLTDCPGYEFQ